MIRIGIAEDDAQYVKTLKEYLDRYSRETGETFDVKIYHNGLELTFDYKPVFDILFLDIEMPEMDGMTAAKKVREKDSKVVIFFITSMAQYAVEGYRVRARSYLLKPLNYISLCLELQDALASLPHDMGTLVLTDENGDRVRLPFGKIIYIESHDHDLLFHVRETGVLRTRATMKEMEEKLPGQYFGRPHASYMVNLSFVTGISGDSVNVGEEKLPISRSRRKEFLKALADYMGRE